MTEKINSLLRSLTPFSSSSELIIGLDIGSFAIKICEMNSSGDKLKLQSLGSCRLPGGVIEDGELADPETAAEAISSLLNNLKIKNRKVGISVSGYSVILKKINLAVMGDTELEEHIYSEAEQYIPFDINDVYLDFHNLHTNTETESRTDIMLVAAKKEVVDGYLQMLEDLNLKPVLVDVDAFALENSYEVNFGSNENITLVDIGSEKISINIISRGSSLFARDAAMGGRHLTEEIQVRLGLDFDLAERLKTGEEEAGEHREVLAEIINENAITWLMEIQKALDFHQANFPESALDKIVLSGGGARIKNLDQLLARETGLRVEIFNPFTTCMVDPGRIDQKYLDDIAPEMAIAMGLASRPAPF